MRDKAPTIAEITRFLRDYSQHPRHQQVLISNLFRWNQMCAALDVIEDAELAIAAYEESDLSDDPGEQYLSVYGVMQALFVQQDAVEHFIEAIAPAITFQLTDVLKDIREVRNMSTGHPTKVKRKRKLSVHGISRITVSKTGFQLISFAEDGSATFHDINVLDLIKKQRAETTRILSEVAEELKKADAQHRAQFKDKKVGDSLKQVTYAFEKISATLRGKEVPNLAEWGAKALLDSLDAFETALKERGMNVETYDLVKHLYREITYPLAQLTKFVNSQSSDIPSSEAALVYAAALRVKFSELMQIADEIDEDYSTPSS